MKANLSIPRRQETLTFESMAGFRTSDSFVSRSRQERQQHQQRRSGLASALKERIHHEAQKVLCFACVAFAIVLLFAVIDFAG